MTDGGVIIPEWARVMHAAFLAEEEVMMHGTTTAIRFDAIPIGEVGQFTAKLGGAVACEVTCARLWLDIERLQGSIGQRVRINGPHVTVGALRSFEYDEATDTARFTIETGGGDE